EPPDCAARRFAARWRRQHELRFTLRPARPREVRSELLLVVIEDSRGRALLAHVAAVDVGILHELDDGVPARLVEAELQRIAGGMAARAVVAYQLLHSPVMLRVVRQRVERDVAPQLAERLLELRVGDQLEILP